LHDSFDHESTNLSKRRFENGVQYMCNVDDQMM